MLDQSNAMHSEEKYNHENSPAEIKELIEEALVDNKILGYIHGKIVNISDPDGLAKPHNLAVARCKLFSECFGVNAVICDKKEMLKVVKEGINNFKLEKTSLTEELEKAKKKQNTILIIVLAICILVPLAVILLFTLNN